VASERCADIEFFLPENGLATLANPTASWSSSAWVEMEDAAGADWLLTSVHVWPLVNAGKTDEIDVGIGAAGAESVVATVRMQGERTYWSWGGMRLPIPSAVIPSGARVSIRGRSYYAYDTSQLQASIGCVALPLSTATSMQTTTKPIKCVPTASNDITVAGSGTAWVWSAWAQLVASAAADLVIGSVTRTMHIRVDCVGEIELGIGAAGAEATVAWYPAGFSKYTGASTRLGCEPVVPVDAIPAGSRIAARWRANTTSTSNVGFALNYYEKPL
jgi:hypothetical protein